MDISNFIKNITEVFEETDPAEITASCNYKNLDEWSSLVALSVIAMVDEEYDVAITGDDIRNSETIEELFNIVKTK